MFNVPTLFIVGAGASWHYGYPTGADLIKRVIEKASNLAHFCEKRQQYAGPLPLYVQQKINPEKRVGPKQAWLQTKEECEVLAERLKHVNPLVIDYFLGRYPLLEEIGRTLIAWTIMQCEADLEEHKYNLNRKDYVELKQAPGFDVEENFRETDDWYRFLIEEMASNCSNVEKLIQNEVCFITFNYDVSLETELFSRLRAIDCFSGEDEKIKSFLNERIHHVYGQIRDGFSPRDKIMKGYAPLGYFMLGQESSYEEISQKIEEWNAAFQAAETLDTIDPIDKNNNQKIPSDKKFWIQCAREVYILGYGFDKNNNERLFLKDLLDSHPEQQKHVHFTNYLDSNKINKRAARLFALDFDSFFPNKPGVVGEPYERFFYEKSVRNVYQALEKDFESFANF
jgi:hypothetical protein